MDLTDFQARSLTASEARALLSEYSLDEVRQLYPGEDDTTINALYLGNLCALGKLAKIEAFIQEHEIYPQHFHAILNCTPYEQWYGNCLHMVMKWNTGDNAIALFTLLYAHGAEYIRNYYEVFPCQTNAPVWIKPLGKGSSRVLAYRNVAEFGDTYEALKIKYALDDSRPPKALDISVGDGAEAYEEDDYDLNLYYAHCMLPDGCLSKDDEGDWETDLYAHCDHPDDGCPTKSKCICACYNCNY